jgi:hypothetical protein
VTTGNGAGTASPTGWPGFMLERNPDGGRFRRPWPPATVSHDAPGARGRRREAAATAPRPWFRGWGRAPGGGQRIKASAGRFIGVPLKVSRCGISPHTMPRAGRFKPAATAGPQVPQPGHAPAGPTATSG